MEGVANYINSNIFGSVPVTINLTSNVFGGQLANGEPAGTSPSPIQFNTRTAITIINGNGFTVTQKFKNAFGGEPSD